MLRENAHTKTNAVLNYLKEHGSITSLEAIQRFKATRLSAIIYTLRKDGYKITSVDARSEGEYGLSRYVKYVLEDISNE